MKKYARNLFLTAALMLSVSLTAFADIGPKPYVRLNTVNAPNEPYYIDLLYEAGDITRLYKNEFEEDYDSEMFRMLFTYESDGWYPALAGGTIAPCFGKLTADENGVHNISYHGVPQTFKIILVTKSGQIRTSEVINPRQLQIEYNLDCDKMTVTSPPPVLTYVKQFGCTFGGTLLIEGIILLLFGIFTKKNVVPFIIINLITQLGFTAVFSTGFVICGYLFDMMFFIPLEIAVTLTEVYTCRKWLKGDKKKITAFALTANIVSAAATFFSLQWLFEIMRLF